MKGFLTLGRGKLGKVICADSNGVEGFYSDFLRRWGWSRYRLWFRWEGFDDLWCGADTLKFGATFSPRDLVRFGVEGAFNVSQANATSHTSREGEVDEIPCSECDFFLGCSLTRLAGFLHENESLKSRAVYNPSGTDSSRDRNVFSRAAKPTNSPKQDDRPR